MDRPTPDTVLSRRRSDAVIEELLPSTPGKRPTVLYDCGCVAVGPSASDGPLNVLACPTHAELQSKLRRRRSDRYEG